MYLVSMMPLFVVAAAIAVMFRLELMAPGDRPIEIVNGGKVRKPLLA